jgi:hypothetical protein
MGAEPVASVVADWVSVRWAGSVTAAKEPGTVVLNSTLCEVWGTPPPTFSTALMRTAVVPSAGWPPLATCSSMEVPPPQLHDRAGARSR